jgi:hypothetical protein
MEEVFGRTTLAWHELLFTKAPTQPMRTAHCEVHMKIAVAYGGAPEGRSDCLTTVTSILRIREALGLQRETYSA